MDLVVIGGMSVRSLAERIGNGTGGQGRRRAEKELLDALNVLVKHFGLDPDRRLTLRMWNDVSKACVNEGIPRESNTSSQFVEALPDFYGKLGGGGMARSIDCELKLSGTWTLIDMDKALKLAANREFRCTECHAAVRVHREGANGSAAHFEHRQAFDGCSRSAIFNGVQRSNPRAIS